MPRRHLPALPGARHRGARLGTVIALAFQTHPVSTNVGHPRHASPVRLTLTNYGQLPLKNGGDVNLVVRPKERSRATACVAERRDGALVHVHSD
jgi:hypothetical protein